MEKNQEVMKEIDMMIKEQGEDLDIIESNIKHTYEKVKEANGELDEADKIQTKNRLLKIKLGVTGLFAGLGGAILGIPGMVVGLFTAFKVTK